MTHRLSLQDSDFLVRSLAKFSTIRGRAGGLKMKKIGVVIPACNEEAYIERCLLALKSAQTYFSIF